MSEIPRSFVNKENIDISSGIIRITDKDEFHYLKNVHRIKVNDGVIILDGEHKQYKSVVTTLEKDSIELKIECCENIKKYPDYNINLVQGILKGDKQEFLLQKATELGVNKIFCINTDYSNVKLTDQKAINTKLTRIQKVVAGASKQSKRGTIPEIAINNNIEEVLGFINQNYKNALTIAFIENEEVKTIKTILKSVKDKYDDIFIFIGPEGGWSEREKELFQNYNITPASLGSNILRAETAALLAIGFIIYEYESK